MKSGEGAAQGRSSLCGPISVHAMGGDSRDDSCDSAIHKIVSDLDSLRRESSRRRVSGLSEEEKAERKKARKDVPRDNVHGFQEPPTQGMPLDIDGYIKSKRGKEVRFHGENVDDKRLQREEPAANIHYPNQEEHRLLEAGRGEATRRQRATPGEEKKTVRRRKDRSLRRFPEKKYYLLVGEWEVFAKENGLRPGDRVKLWSYTVDREDRKDLLQFAISEIVEKITEHVVTDSESGKDTVIVQKGSMQLIYN